MKIKSIILLSIVMFVQLHFHFGRSMGVLPYNITLRH